MTNVIKKIAHGNQMYIVAWGGSAGDGMETVYLTQSQYDSLTPEEKADTTKQYAIISSTSGSLDADVVNYDNTTSGATATDVQWALDEVFQSVSNGKELIADAITDKGVSTSATDSFSTMAGNITSLHTITEQEAQSYSSILSESTEWALKYFAYKEWNSADVWAYNDKKNVNWKDVYMISAAESSNRGGTVKIVIVEEDWTTTLKTFTNISVYENNFCAVIKYFPTENVIVIGERLEPNVHYAVIIDFDTYEQVSTRPSSWYDDSYLSNVQGNWWVDFLLYSATWDSNHVWYAIMSPIAVS